MHIIRSPRVLTTVLLAGAVAFSASACKSDSDGVTVKPTPTTATHTTMHTTSLSPRTVTKHPHPVRTTRKPAKVTHSPAPTPAPKKATAPSGPLVTAGATCTVTQHGGFGKAKNGKTYKCTDVNGTWRWEPAV